MKAKKEYKTISSKTKKMLQGSEGYDVDFKQDSKSIKVKDIIAFANAAEGGTILAGIEEIGLESGLQRGRIIGCDVSDSAILSIINKAADCFPSIKVNIYIENIRQKSFLRIDIPSSPHRPHCTSSGEYSLRMQQRTKGLHPNEMLSIFLSKESDTFLSNFKASISETESKIDKLNEKMLTTSDTMLNKLWEVYHDITTSIEEAIFHLEESANTAEETKHSSQEIWQMIKDIHSGMSNVELNNEIVKLQKSIDTIIYKNNFKDPNLDEKKWDIFKMYMSHHYSNKNNQEPLELTISKRYPFLTESHIKELSLEAQKKFHEIKN